MIRICIKKTQNKTKHNGISLISISTSVLYKNVNKSEISSFKLDSQHGHQRAASTCDLSVFVLIVLWGRKKKKLLTQYCCGRLTFYVQYAVGTRLTIYFTDAGPQSAVRRSAQTEHTDLLSLCLFALVNNGQQFVVLVQHPISPVIRQNILYLQSAHSVRLVHQRLCFLLEHRWARLLMYLLRVCSLYSD